jgi:ferredoxin
MQLEINWALCDGNGNCVAEAPEVFDFNDDDTLKVLVETPGEELRAQVEQAAAACPKRAITVGD